jgi:predicted class III extradiol MEMO1 family dioxygenase
MLLLYAVPPLIALSYPWHAQEAAGVVALAAWMIMATTYLPTARLYGKPKAAAFLLPAAGVIYCAMTVSSAWKHLRGRGGAWKGRIYPQNAR